MHDCGVAAGLTQYRREPWFGPTPSRPFPGWRRETALAGAVAVAPRLCRRQLAVMDQRAASSTGERVDQFKGGKARARNFIMVPAAMVRSFDPAPGDPCPIASRGFRPRSSWQHCSPYVARALPMPIYASTRTRTRLTSSTIFYARISCRLTALCRERERSRGCVPVVEAWNVMKIGGAGGAHQQAQGGIPCIRSLVRALI
jgi:hypothetical protein